MVHAPVTHRRVIGVGGTGRTHWLRAYLESWSTATQSQSGGPALHRWIQVTAGTPLDEDRLAALSEGARLLIVDDAQWATEGALRMLLQRVLDGGELWISRRPWPSSDALRELDDVLDGIGETIRTGPLEAEEYRAFVSERSGRPMANEIIDALAAATGGLAGLTADALDAGWSGDCEVIPETLIDAVLSRLRRSGDAGEQLAMAMAFAPEVELSVLSRSLRSGVDLRSAQRAIRAAGLCSHDGQLLPLVRSSLISDLSPVEREDWHRRIGVALAPHDPFAAAFHLRQSGTNADQTGSVPGVADATIGAASRLLYRQPEAALETLEALEAAGALDPTAAAVRAEAAFVWGHPDVLAFVNTLDPVSATAQLLRYGVAIRELRWDQAATGELPDELGAMLRALSEACIGRFDSAWDRVGTTPVAQMIAGVVNGLELLSVGDEAAGLAALAGAVDDASRLGTELPLGISPHFIAAAGALSVGDLTAAEDFAGLGIAHLPRAEAQSSVLLLAYIRLLDGRFSDALDAVRAGAEPWFCGRDRWLLAVLEAAIARRSGDTARLRESWRIGDSVLLRHQPSWCLIDPVTELVAAGAKLGHWNRVQPIIDTLMTQVDRLDRAVPDGHEAETDISAGSPSRGRPSDGDASGAGDAALNARWLRLQAALASDEGPVIDQAVAWFSHASPHGARAQARRDAAGLWAALSHGHRVGPEDEATIIDVAAALADAGEAWEASRLVGQAAIDTDDGALARRLLERARLLAAEVGDESAADPLRELGLSEREAEVARLVAEGRTHKEIGSQLFISPKTVEHHVARIRQRLGAGSRAELLAIIRETIG